MKWFIRLGLCVVASLAAASVCRAGVIVPSQSINGVSQADLSARWWQWGASYPNGANPIQDTTGAFSSLGADQTPVAHPGVFFLAGNFSTPSTRSVTVGSDQHLFFPLINALSAIPFFGNTEAEIRADAAATLGTVSGLYARLNGVDLPLPAPTTSLLDYRQLSPPGTFPLTLPVDNVFGAPPGTFDAVSDGYWLALGPLAPGNYLLEFGGQASGTPGLYDPFSQAQTYQITVQAVPEPTSLVLFSLGGVVLLVLRRRAMGKGSARSCERTRLSC